MKKVMIGILILIPIIVLLIVLAVGAIISMEVYIAVESVAIVDADGRQVKNITVSTSDLEEGVFDVSKYAYLQVLPEKATNKTVTWTIEGLRCLDNEYEQAYEYYIEHKDEPGVTEVKPAAMLIDDNGLEVGSNNSGKVEIRTYCTFSLKAAAGIYYTYVRVEVVGFDVEKVSIASTTEQDSFKVGNTMRLVANYTPVDSKVSVSEWKSDNEEVATVDQNGVVTARKAGTANITHKASVYSSEGEGTLKFVESAPYAVTVEAGASAKYGDALVTSKPALTFAELGLDSGFEVVSGGTVSGDTLTITGDEVVLTNGEKTFVITRCAEDDIAIANKDLFDNRNEANNFILESDGKPFQLFVVWADQTKDGTPAGVSWTSSNNRIATVSANGELKAVGSGVVRVTATLGAKSVDIELNVREKLTTIKLETSALYFAVGIARETVFASDKFVDVSVDHTKEANSTLIRIDDEPENEAELSDFYSAYKFEVVQGGEYARFDENIVNKLAFIGSALEGKGKQQIIVRVSARYPKYETMPHYTTEEVSFFAIYGTEVSNAVELKEASKDQKEYAYANALLTKDVNGYDVYKSSSKTMAIVLAGDAVFDEDYVAIYGQDAEVNGKIVKRFNDPSRIDLYGDLYGNNHTLSSWKELLFDKYSELTHVAWSNVTVSNIHIRANTLGEDTTFSNDDTQGLWGDSIDFETIADDFVVNPWGRVHLENVRVEFSLLENGLKISSIYDTDVTFDGCVLRNVAQCAFYSPVSICSYRVDTASGTVYPDEGPYFHLPVIYYPKYCHININNIMASNMLGTLTSFSYDHYTIDGDGNYFFGQTKDTIDQYMYDNYISKGYNLEFNQTGFLDLYNWQPSSATNMIKTGNDTVDALIQRAIGALVDHHKDLEPYKYEWERNGIKESWFHMGMVVTGLSNFPQNEKVYFYPTFEDKRIGHFYAHDLKDQKDENEVLYMFFKGLEFHIYLYDNSVDITPESQDPKSEYYSIPDGEDLINHMHGAPLPKRQTEQSDN